MRITTTDSACACGSHAARARAHTRDGITASGVYASEQLGERQSITPEGFLLCEAVPIARVGAQDYAYFELPEIEAKDGVIVAERTADVLFSPETLASFEGKPITIDHPPDFVTPANFKSVVVGFVMNVRRGEGDQSDLMLADLLIFDAEAIRLVQLKVLAQVSNGYDADYEQIAPGRARQVAIVGNHVALVKSARCGPVCSIGDSSSNLLPTGDASMATKKGSKFVDALRKAFMTRDSEAFEKVASELTGDEGGEGGDGQPQIHIHMPGTGGDPKPGVSATGDDGAEGSEGDPLKQVLDAIQATNGKIDALAERVTKLEGGGTQTGDDDPDADDDPNPTMDDDPDPQAAKTGDSTALRDQFQEALSRAEILAPGVRLPTFDAKAARKKTVDAICVLRRRALRAALENENAELVKPVVGGANVASMTCDSVTAFFNAASELVRNKNSGVTLRRTNDSAPTERKDINQIHADFWKNRK
ncbi:DUF2213 domain-containing protein [Burkholderia multivorans]|uniref:DUF2213 domain-containing protein n=1 Tax=Burkholderia multivorans TaxID=87883 RepID=UPI00158B6E2C|nr:DUF2213 domain-containing protein [Burkholderia multivorans]MBU9293096.1 DUF2213 domain-containing protein [Burkholderia multivorans]MCO1367184.1 DUF2213 domain-containing protein [Burkholderia multivorans]MCO1376793.1 DUF2213 domain-containing protein [Burkholderia multivorans]MDI3305397.1 DUF2213 domain-containing protein [Burkholderia multivorans]MDN7609899.1 DUF2213 domain-containing protein [Burkholderia multivorans]